MKDESQSPQEIERKFLVRPPYEPGSDGVQFQQGYLTAEKPEVRIRILGDSEAQLTVKGHETRIEEGAPSIRLEENISLPVAQGQRLLGLTLGSITKERFREGRWEVDFYRGDLEGLIVAEVELESADEPLPPLPDSLVLGPELSGDRRFSNQALAFLPSRQRQDLLRHVWQRLAEETG